MAVILVMGTSTTQALAGATPTRTLFAQTVTRARAYATALLDDAALPSDAKLVTHLPTSLGDSGGTPGIGGLTDVHREYLVGARFGVEAFVFGHLRKGYAVSGTGNGSGPGIEPVASVNVTIPCPSRHVTYCRLTYSSTVAKDGQGELRLDLLVVWMPVRTVEMPTTGTVSVTGYGMTSLMSSSSNPDTVVLSASQAKQLHDAIATLKNTDGGTCMEDELLLKIVVVGPKGRLVRWSATADACPGVLSVEHSKSGALLDVHSCAFWKLVSSFFPTGKANGTKVERRYCSASQ